MVSSRPTLPISPVVISFSMSAQADRPRPNHVIVGTPTTQPESRSRRIHTAGDKRTPTPATPLPTKHMGDSRTVHHTPTNGKYDEVALEEIPWVPLVVGSEDPGVFANGRGWVSPPGSRFPFDVVLGLSRLANIYKVIVDVNDRMYPATVDICIGRGHAEDGVDYSAAKRARYGAKGEINFRKRDNTRMEARTFYADHVGNFLWLVLNRPFRTSSNPHEQVGIDRIVVLGYPMKNAEGVEAERRKERRAESADRRVASAKEVPRSAGRRERGQPPAPSPPPLAPHGNGDGMETRTEALASDPISSLRMVKRVLTEKMNGAHERGMDVEANVCRRAVQRLEEYELRMEDLGRRRANALIHKDTAEAATPSPPPSPLPLHSSHSQAGRISSAMNDCRDTVFRAIHVDLLLSRSELRSIGVSSSWAE